MYLNNFGMTVISICMDTLFKHISFVTEATIRHRFTLVVKKCLKWAAGFYQDLPEH